jgi:hypothetical protein
MLTKKRVPTISGAQPCMSRSETPTRLRAENARGNPRAGRGMVISIEKKIEFGKKRFLEPICSAPTNDESALVLVAGHLLKIVRSRIASLAAALAKGTATSGCLAHQAGLRGAGLPAGVQSEGVTRTTTRLKKLDIALARRGIMFGLAGRFS